MESLNSFRNPMTQKKLIEDCTIKWQDEKTVLHGKQALNNVYHG